MPPTAEAATEISELISRNPGIGIGIGVAIDIDIEMSADSDLDSESDSDPDPDEYRRSPRTLFTHAGAPQADGLLSENL